MMRAHKLTAAGLAILATAASPAFAQGDASGPQARVAEEFIGLGMPEAQANCFGEVLDERLNDQQLETAAGIVAEAGASENVRQGVTDAGMVMMDAFSQANNECRRWGRER